MNRIVRLLAVCAVLWGAVPTPVRAWQAAGPEPALIDLAPQRYGVPDVPRDVASDVPAPDVASADPAADAGAGLLYHDLFLLPLWAVPGGRADGTGLRWLEDADAAVPDRPLPLRSAGLDTWTLGASNWRYRSSAGYGLTLGNTAAGAPAAGRAVRLAGVGLSRALPPRRLTAGSWDYAVVAGVVDRTAVAAPAEGDLSYGPLALDATTRYAPVGDLTLASRLQSTRELTALGLGGDYAMGDAGAWRFGVSGSRSPLAQGWRRRLGYTVGLWQNLDLSWVNARQGAGYADLATYAGNAGCDCISNQWQLDLAAGRWGSVSGSFERRVDTAGGLDERVGLAHGFRYGPYLRVQLETQRNLHTGDYGVGARFSLPLDW